MADLTFDGAGFIKKIARFQQMDSLFSETTREEKHFEGEKNTLNHIKFVTQSMLDLLEGKFDVDLPFVSEARASLQNQKDLMVLAAMFHDAAKPYRHGDIHIPLSIASINQM